jgi:hypothetical protein
MTACTSRIVPAPRPACSSSAYTRFNVPPETAWRRVEPIRGLIGTRTADS